MQNNRARLFLERLAEGGPLLQRIEHAWAHASPPTLEELARFAGENGYRFSGDEIAALYRQDAVAASQLNDLLRNLCK
ncbi:MAG: hypothetical protein ACLFTK_07975 [Anaerolineales bacterium]